MQVSGKQTFCTTLNLRGYSEVTSGTAGTLQLHSGSSINASGINNEIAVSLTISRACTINVDDGGILKLSGGLSDHVSDLADDRIITKTGNGTLEITGGANFARVFKQNAGTTEISGAAATFQQGINVAEGATFTAISDVVLGGTIVNNGTVNISGTLSLNPIDVGNFVLKSYGTESGKYTDGENGWKTYYGNSYYLVDTDNSNSVLRVDTDAIRLGENNNIQLDKTSEAGKISFTYEAAGYDSASSYYVNTGTVQAASNYASNFVIAEGATLKISDELAGTKTYNVTGTGTLAVSIAKTTGHGNIVDAAGFNGILALSKGGNSSKGNVELNKYNDNTYLGADASLKLISGNHWSGGNTTLTRDILLAGEAEGDFKFCHTDTLTLSGKVTGTYLYAGGAWDQNVDTCAGSTANHLKLSGAGSDIDSVKMINESTLTVAETMRFGKISANKVVIEASKQLDIGKQGIEGGSTISTLEMGQNAILKMGQNAILNMQNGVSTISTIEMGQNAILNVQNGAVVTVNSKLKGGSAKVTDSSLLRIDGNTTVEDLASVELSNGSTLSVRNGQYGHTFASAISVLGTNILTSGWGGNDMGGINGSINGSGTLQLGQEIWQGSETGDRWILNSTISDKSANEKLAINSFANVRITGQNTYSGGTTITKGTLRTEHLNALGTGTVKMQGGTLEMAAALSVTAMEYTNGTVNNGGRGLNVGTLTVAEGATMSPSGSGATTAAVVELKSGASLSAAGTLTMGSLSMADGSKLAASDTITLSGSDNRVLDLGSKLTLDGEWFNNLLAELTGSNTAALFAGVTELKLNGVAYANQVDLADHFLNVEQGKYYLVYADSVVYAGLGEVIPEPTTATLSLLALAGLCARRRRRA